MKVIIMGILWIHKNYDNDNCLTVSLKIIKSIRKEKGKKKKKKREGYVRGYETEKVTRG